MVNKTWFCILSLNICVVTSLIAILSIPSYANEASDLIFIREVNPIQKEKRQESISIEPQVSSELKFAATALIRLYQVFVSSQDGPSCGFSPSCSRFGMAAIKEYGIIRGVLLTADRLLRCNGSQAQHYHKEHNSEKYADPISDYAK